MRSSALFWYWWILQSATVLGLYFHCSVLSPTATDFGSTLFNFGTIFCFICLKFLDSFLVLFAFWICWFMENEIAHTSWFASHIKIFEDTGSIVYFQNDRRNGCPQGLISNRLWQKGGLICGRRRGWDGSSNLWFLNRGWFLLKGDWRRNQIHGCQVPKLKRTPWAEEGLGLTPEPLIPKTEPLSL